MATLDALRRVTERCDASRCVAIFINRTVFYFWRSIARQLWLDQSNCLKLVNWGRSILPGYFEAKLGTCISSVHLIIQVEIRPSWMKKVLSAWWRTTPVIFDVSDANYKQILIKETAWEEIAEVLVSQSTVYFTFRRRWGCPSLSCILRYI